MKKILLLVLAVIIITLLVAPVVLAATGTGTDPIDIYNDFVANHGKLTGHYTHDQLEAYLNNLYVHEYMDKGVLSQLDKLVAGDLGGRNSFPFTGFQMMIAGIVAVALVGGGFALRRFSRQS